ncbi:mechanosensitive ion channel [Draconibacterium sp. IB214405]|uniref:mechanosensitive ion channel family protein n=1 Tax=Draconibacterium sp. IB214405 TaxID=3097352 RepID=UPI002A0EB1B7|nr:mechanosensitive ion channel domain-containing protein [Draconibacterium sp. IB214405]MDX8338086.1 mechanosensitive ion channel [Draconibacterium sp. IB214405]
MKFKDILSIELYSKGDFTISVYNIFLILVVVIATFIALKIIGRFFKRFIKKQETERRSYWSVYLILRYVVWVIIIILLLESSGLKISVLLASITALLVGVGFGIQQLFSDLASGIVLLFERNLQINDVIQLEDGTVGRVIHIGLRTSKLKTRDDIILVVPNSKFVNDKIINWSQMDYNTRFSVNVGVAYGSDTQKVAQLLVDCAKQNKHISNIPKPFARFNNFGDSALEFQIFFWVREPFWVENIKSELRFAIDDAFRQNNVQIPFPQRDVHIKSTGENPKG